MAEKNSPQETKPKLDVVDQNGEKQMEIDDPGEGAIVINKENIEITVKAMLGQNCDVKWGKGPYKKSVALRVMMPMEEDTLAFEILETSLARVAKTLLTMFGNMRAAVFREFAFQTAQAQKSEQEIAVAREKARMAGKLSEFDKEHGITEEPA